ncbi:MFS general substrate transporter [Hypoxylon sp. FL1150]|nr:MFS general substrate transporter [Hypoxylon sp. FL1150]
MRLEAPRLERYLVNMGGGTSSSVQHHDVSDEATEYSTLLPHGRPRRPPHRPTLSVTSIANSVHVPKAHSKRTIIALLCLITFVVSSADGFTSIPAVRLLEDIICRQHYGLRESGNPVDEKLCKDDAVQSKVAFIMAIQSSLEAAVGLLAAFPWGLVADKIGRKPVFSIGLCGMLVNIFWRMAVVYFHTAVPIQLVWLGSAGLLIGGGQAVLLGILLSMTTDSTTEEERAIVFMRLHIASLCGDLISPALSSVMMQRVGPWPPIWVAVAIIIISAIAFLFVPETLKHQPDRGEVEEPGTDMSGFKSRILHVFYRFKESLSIFKSTSLILLLLTSLGARPVIATLQFMAQFISKRYDIALAETGYVQSVYGIAQVAHSLILLPWLARFVMKDTTPAKFRAEDEHHRDLSFAKWSYGVLAIGIAALGLAPTLPAFVFGLVVAALGSGFNSLTRSLMSLYVDPEHRSRLFSLVGMVEVVGSVYAQPMMAGLFTLGMRLGGEWIGLPYFVLSVLIAAAASLLLFVRVPKEAGDSSTPEGGQH